MENKFFSSKMQKKQHFGKNWSCWVFLYHGRDVKMGKYLKEKKFEKKTHAVNPINALQAVDEM